MNKQNYILMIFEGEKTEKIIFNNLKRYFLNDKANRIVYGFHCGEIYSLYNKLNKTGESIFYILKEQLKSKNQIFENIRESSVESIYLFFDYDGHAISSSFEKLHNMLEFFDDEFENGKLYISYPIVGALRHIKNDVNFQNTVAISQKEYKNISKDCEEKYLIFKNYTKDTWYELIKQHCKKANFIVKNSFTFLTNTIGQINIVNNQKIKYIDISNEVAVVSAFSIFLADYCGYHNMQEIIK